MKTAYEAVFIVDPTLADEGLKTIVDKYTSVLTRTGAEIDDIDIWEPRRLAYPVKGFREGRYVVVNFIAEPASRDEMDRIFRISDDVIRNLIIKQDPKADRYPSKARVAEVERREREMAARASVSVDPLPIIHLPAEEEEETVETAGANTEGVDAEA